MSADLHHWITEASKVHGSLRALAEATGIDVGYLSRLASGEKDAPSDEVLAKLRLRKIVTYVPEPKGST